LAQAIESGHKAPRHAWKTPSSRPGSTGLPPCGSRYPQARRGRHAPALLVRQAPLRGKDKIALAVGVDVDVNHYTMAKHFVIAIADSDLTFERNAFLLLDVPVKQ